MPGVRPGQETPSAQLGTLLLRGYTMLAEACPDCHIPLMRDPATMQSQCVGCHHFYSPAEVQALSSPQQEQPAAEPTPLSSGPLADTPAAVQGSSHGAVAGTTAQHSTRPMNGPLTSALARHRRATSTSGSSDGAGSPNLMPSAAPITPAAGPLSAGILSPPSSAPSLAAGAAAGTGTPGAAAGAPGGGIGSGLGSESSSSRVHYHETPDAEVLQAYQQIRAERQRDEQRQLLYGRQQPPRLQQQQQALQANGSAAAGPGRQQGDVSQLMADKLLAGWALLGDHCPMCSTPLMRERSTREVYCVACNLPVRVQQQPQQQQQQQAAAGNTGSSVQTAETPDQHSMPAQPGTAGLNGAAGGDAAAATTGAAAAAAASGTASDAVVLGPGPTMQLVGGTLQQSGGGAAAAAGGRAAGAAGAAAASPAVSGQAGSLISSKQQVLGDLHHALLLKLDEARQQLLLTPAGQAEQLGVQLQLVQQLLQTLAALPQ